MDTIQLETTVATDGVLFVPDLPLLKGEAIVVTIQKVDQSSEQSSKLHPYRGQIYQYIDPFEPAIRIDDWEVFK